jgi:predicted dehydrogenase
VAAYRAGVIGLGWMGLLSDLGCRPPDRYEVDDTDRPTPDLDVHRRFHFHEGQGEVDVPHSWAEVMHQSPDVDLVAGAERDPKRLAVFGERYGLDAVYDRAEDLLKNERLDIVAIATNTKGRADLTCLAVECGVKAIAVEKPIAHRLEETDRMVRSCTDAGVSLCAGAIPVNHPSYGATKELIQRGELGEVLSIEVEAPAAQKQHWSLFIDSAPAWVIGSGDDERRESGSDEFVGQGMMVTTDGGTVFFRKGAGLLRVTGTTGEITLDGGWRLWQDVETLSGKQRVEVKWPGPRLAPGYNAVYGLADLVDCLEGRLDEPKNSGRRVAGALEVEIALKQSSTEGGVRVDLPLSDRSLGLHYDWFR